MRQLSDAELLELSRTRRLALTLDELHAIQAHFHEVGRDPTDLEMETIAQTWSEHCSHKTLKGRISCGDRGFENLLGETIFAATQEIRARLGADDWCVSVFDDNAGIVKFDDEFHLCFKVETHNRPSAIDPYRGAATGLGGVIRDVLGCGLGGKPLVNTDVFCVGPLDTPKSFLPPGIIHPRDLLRGVVKGIADYGNHCGIPTVNGAVILHDRYTANPLVFCGSVGLIPVDRVAKSVHPGDRLVVIGGKTGRDGIHGATVSSEGLDQDSEKSVHQAIQSGCPFTGKKLITTVLRARDQGLFRSITDCGAGGLSSAIGEMCASIGALIHLERVPLKGESMTPAEIWISESQERMVLALPAANVPALLHLCREEGITGADIGECRPSGHLRVLFGGEFCANLSMSFLHNGRPSPIRIANIATPPPVVPADTPAMLPIDRLKALLAAPNIRSREAIIRQYDHEVQGTLVLRPLVGKWNDGPGDAAVIAPQLGSHRGVAIGCGIKTMADLPDPYEMAVAAIDEAVRNVIAVGADPGRIALLDNIAWGEVNTPESLGALVRVCEACHDVSLAWEMPFISGKDSLRNEFHRDGHDSAIPGTLLISAVGLISDVRKCTSMDLKEAWNRLILVGSVSGSVFDLRQSRRLHSALHAAMVEGLIRACHDLSDGGLAVAVAEMAIAGGIGAELLVPGDFRQFFDAVPTCWLVEARHRDLPRIAGLFHDLPWHELGDTNRTDRLQVASIGGGWTFGVNIEDLRQAWWTPLN